MSRVLPIKGLDITRVDLESIYKAVYAVINLHSYYSFDAIYLDPLARENLQKRAGASDEDVNGLQDRLFQVTKRISTAVKRRAFV